jgi:hypothetical protein
VLLKLRLEAEWKNGAAVLPALSASNENVMLLELDVLHPKSEAFREAETGPIENSGDEKRNSPQLPENA